jgi:hypothetical protein
LNRSLPATQVAAAFGRFPGIGPIVATAIVAAIGNGAAFRKGRDFAAWLGLVPRQYSTGGKAKLLGISKRGNIYLRKILIHGARAAALRIKRDRFAIGAWMNALEAERRATCWWWPWRTSSHGSHGPCSRVEKTIGLERTRFPHKLERKRRLRLGSADALPLSLHYDDGFLPTKVCTGTARTKEQSQRRV